MFGFVSRRLSDQQNPLDSETDGAGIRRRVVNRKPCPIWIILCCGFLLHTKRPPAYRPLHLTRPVCTNHPSQPVTVVVDTPPPSANLLLTAQVSLSTTPSIPSIPLYLYVFGASASLDRAASLQSSWLGSFPESSMKFPKTSILEYQETNGRHQVMRGRPDTPSHHCYSCIYIS